MARKKSFNRQIKDPKGDLQALNERMSVHKVEGKGVMLKEGYRIIAYYDHWTDPEIMNQIRDSFIAVIQDPVNAPDPDWSFLNN
jgi:hypothetical protein